MPALSLVSFNNILKYILFCNKTSIAAIHGYGFRQAGARAFNLIINNIMRVLAISTVGDYVLSLAKLFVAAGSASLGYLMIRVSYICFIY